MINLDMPRLVRACSCGLAFLLVSALEPRSETTSSAPVGESVFLRSKTTDRYLAAWAEGASADIHASARYADERAEAEIADAGNGFIALRSRRTNTYWTVAGAGPDVKVFCSGSEWTEGSLFAWIENPDGSISLRSKANGRYLSVVEEDTTMVPFIDSSTLATVASLRESASDNPDASPSLLVTPEMMRPYKVTYQVIHAAAAAIGDAEKFLIGPKALEKASAAERLSKTLTYMYSISGKETIGGIHNREPNSNPARWTNWVQSQTGKYPGLWGGDFLYDANDQANRGTMINEAKTQWNSGAAVTLMYHMCPPTQGEACGWSGGVQSKLSDAQWTQLITNGSALNGTFKQRLRSIGNNLQTLKASGVEVMLRPFHEMNQGAFWWGGRTGPNGTSRLYQITHDYLVDTLGLTNVFFIWSVQDLSWNFQDYNPGDSYWDIMTLDVYNGDGYTAKKYNAMLDIAGPKLIGIAETAHIPSSALLKTQPRWIYFSGWSELTQQNNSAAAIMDSYTASNTVSRDEMPGWGNVNAAAGIAESGTQPRSTPLRLNLAARSVSFEVPENAHVRISLHDARGRLLATLIDGEYGAGVHTSALARELTHGIYLVKLRIGERESSRRLAVLDQ